MLQCIIGKAVMRIARLDMVIAAGSSQVCASLEGWYEAAVHAVRDIFSHKDTEEILLVDAANAFTGKQPSIT